CFQCPGAGRGEHHRGPLGGEAQRDRAPDAATAARDDGGLVRKPHVGLPGLPWDGMRCAIFFPIPGPGSPPPGNERNSAVCRNRNPRHTFPPPASDDEIRASALQFVRKLSGFTKPSRANEPAFDRAVEQVTSAARELLGSLVTSAPPRDREV